jgi:hypothetical protein
VVTKEQGIKLLHRDGISVKENTKTLSHGIRKVKPLKENSDFKTQRSNSGIRNSEYTLSTLRDVNKEYKEFIQKTKIMVNKSNERKDN